MKRQQIKLCKQGHGPYTGYCPICESERKRKENILYLLFIIAFVASFLLYFLSQYVYQLKYYHYYLTIEKLQNHR